MKKVGNILLDILIVIVVLLALAMSVMVISSKATGVPNVLGYSPVTVQTDSMEPTFNVGDLLIIKQCDTSSLKVDDIITFKMILNKEEVLNTHRIIGIINAGGLLKFKTRGDNASQEDINAAVSVDIVGKYTGYRIPGVGKALDFIKSQMGIMVCFVIPLALLFIWQLYKFIMLLADSKKQKAVDAVTESLEAEKQKAVEEYIAQQKALAEAEQKAKQDIPPPPAAEVSVPPEETENPKLGQEPASAAVTEETPADEPAADETTEEPAEEKSDEILAEETVDETPINASDDKTPSKTEKSADK